MSKTRVDKWIWSVRIFKSRTLATNACKANRVKINSKLVKASTSVEVNDVVSIQKNGFNFEFKVLKLINKRVGAPLAVECYENVTPEEELNKYNSWFVGKGRAEIRDKGAGRPTKKERREIVDYKENVYDIFDWEDE